MHQRNRSRGGYLLVYVLVLSLVMGALVFAYQESFRQRNVQVRLNTDRVAARFLARAALDALRWGFREAPDPARLAGNLDLENGPLLPFVLADAKGLARRIARKTDGADHRALIDQLLGPEALAGLDRLVAEVKGAQVQVFAEMTPVTGLPASPVKDAAQKTLNLTLRSVAKVRKAVESYAVTETMVVYSLLPAAAKFTLAGVEVGSVNTHRVTTAGTPAVPPEGSAPVVLFHTPGDCDVLTATPFEGTPGSEKPLVDKPVPPAELVKANAARGLVYLDSNEPDRVVKLNVTSGATPLGEMHSVYRTDDGKPHPAPMEPVADPPGKLANFRAADPANPQVEQVPTLIGSSVGFHKDLNNTGALYPLPAAPTGNPVGPGYEGDVPEAAPEFVDPATIGTEGDPAAADPGPPPEPPPAEAKKIGASLFKLYGTGTFPSPTTVLGNVKRVLAWVAHLGIDRDASQNDENAQATAIGKNLPVPDGRDPVLVNCDEGTYRADVALEQSSGPVQYRRLQPFGEQGQVVNYNASADLDGDGVAEATVAGEEGTFNVDLTLWKYGALFENYQQYKAVMSRELEYPANLSLHLPGLPSAQAGELLRNIALDRPASVPVNDFLLAKARVDHRDRLHAQLGGGGDLLAWLDLDGAAPDALRTVLVQGLAKRFPGDDPVIVKGQKALEREFMVGGALDLKGLRVRVVAEGPKGTASLAFAAPLNVRPGSGGLLEVDRIELPGILNKGDADAFAPLIVRAREVVLTAKGPYEALIAARSVRMEDFKSFAVVKGALFLEEPALELANPLVVTYDPRMDPTGEAAQLYYRVAYSAGARGYDLLERP